MFAAFSKESNIKWKSFFVFANLTPYLYLLTPKYNDYSLPNYMLIYYNFQKHFQKYYEIGMFTALAISKKSK